MQVNTSPLVPLSPLSSLSSLANATPSCVQAATITTITATKTTPSQARATNANPPSAQRFLTSNKQIHLSQLQLLLERIPTTKIPVDQVLLMAPITLFRRIYVACLMHAFYRPMDPGRTILLLLADGKYNPCWQPDLPSPTHIIGLLHSAQLDTSFLVWGACKLVGDKLLEICYTLYASTGAIQSMEDLQEFRQDVEILIEASVPSLYTIASTKFVPLHRSASSIVSSEPMYRSEFCQLISTVVYEFPCNFSASGEADPVRPLWAPNMVEAQARILLGQLVEGSLSLNKIIKGDEFVPPCVYLHGDSYDWDALELMDTHPDPESEDEEMEDEEVCGGQGNVDESATLATLESNQAGVELTKEADWYVTTTDGVIILSLKNVAMEHRRYQISAPTDYSGPQTPTSSPSTSSGGQTINVDDGSGKRSLDEAIIRSFQTRFIQHRAHQHPARVSYWKQLKESTPSDECIGLVTTHLWFSALLKSPKPETLYIDPPLFEQLVDQYQQNPVEMTADQVPLLFNRHEFWPQMGSNVHILALAHAPQVCSLGGLSWLLLDLAVCDGCLKSVEVTIPPCGTFDNDAFGDLVSFFIGALNHILPGPKLAGVSSRVQQRTMTLVLPEPFTEEATVLVLMAYTLGKILDQAILGVDVKAMRQSLCYYYNQVLRCSEVDYGFPWPGLTDSEGALMTENNSDKVGRRRFMLASNREPSPIEMFPRQRSYSTTLATPGPSEPFFLELAQSNSLHPEGILLGTTGRSVPDLKKAILLGQFPSLNKKFPGYHLEVPEALALQDYIELVKDLGGPESAAALRFFLLAKHNEERIKLDWLKDAVYLEPEQLHAGFDLDSLTLSSYEAPQLLKPGAYYAIPDPRFSLTTRNELYIDLDGERIAMHTCPNFCIMTFGGNNQFRLLVFFPRNRQREENLWRNTADPSETKDWYETFLTALRIFSSQAPFAWQHAVEKTLEALPNTFEMASEQRNKGGLHSSGHRIEPVIMNAVFKIMRRIIDTDPGLAKYRGYFFHLCGMNLKLATMTIHGRMDDNPMEYTFSLFNFVDWYSANPHDIVADIGWTANPNRRMMPDNLQNATLLFRVGPLTELMREAYLKPQIDQYCSSYVVGGLRSTPSANVRKGCGIVKAQAYPKDMVLTYRHQNQSVGWNWTVKQALRIGSKDKFSNQMAGFLNITRDADTYGVRFEVRVSAWGANRVMKTEPRDILDRMLAAKAIVCYPTGTISTFKSTLAQGWSAIINRQSQLAMPARKSPEVVLLASVLAYWLKSLIKRPDEMGYSTEMAKRLQLTQNAERYGIPCLRSASLDDDGIRMSYRVEAERFRILSLSGLTVEAPVIPDNVPIRVIQQPDPLHSPPPSPPQVQPVNQPWPQSSQDFLETLINVHFPWTLWSHFTRDRLQNSPTALSLRKKPLQKRHWPLIVEPLNTLKELENKFSDSFDRLFPLNWSITQPKGDLVAYERDFLHRIKEHVNTKPVKSRSAYSSELRRRIRTMLTNTWDYLPNVHSHRIWAYDPGPAGQRIFRICPKSR